MAKGTTKGIYAREQYAQDARRLAEIEASIARQLALIGKLATRSGRDTTQADDLLQVLLHARGALIEQCQANTLGTAAPQPASAASAAAETTRPAMSEAAKRLAYARAQAHARARYLDEARERVGRQEQVIAYLAANGRSTALAEKRLLRRRQALDALLQRHEQRGAGQDSTMPGAIPGQPGTVEQDGQPGSEAP